MASLAPFGLSVSQKHVGQTREYIIRSSDTTAYGIGDPVKSTNVIFQGRLPDGRPTQGLPGVTKAASGDRIRGVIVGIAPAQIGTDSMSIPATKARDYVVLVNDDPRTVYEIQANNTAALGALVGSYANFVTASPAGSVSGIYLDSTSFNASAGDVRALSVEKNEGANSVLRVLFAFHEDALPLTAAETAAVQSLASGATLISTSRAALASDNGATLELAASVTYTLTDAVALAAGVILIGPASGSATLAVTGTATINGATSSVTIGAAQMCFCIPRDTSQTDFVVTTAGGGGGTSYDSVTISATTAALRAAPCAVAGLVCGVSSSGRWRLYDSMTATGTPLYDATLATGQIVTFPSALSFLIGLTAELVSGTGNITIQVR